jgi:hypothetical protein
MGLPSTGLLLTGRGPGIQANLRRYAAESFPVALGALPDGKTELLRIPTDRSPRPWTLQLSGAGGVTVCPKAG